MIPEFLLVYSCLLNNMPNACSNVLSSYLAYNSDLKNMIRHNEQKINLYAQRYPVLLYIGTPVLQGISGRPISFSINSYSSVSIDTYRNMLSINIAF